MQCTFFIYYLHPYKIPLRKLRRIRNWILILNLLAIDIIFTISSFKKDIYFFLTNHSRKIIDFSFSWQLDKSYNDMLAACWDKNRPVHDNLQALQHNIKEWKFLSFDTVIERKKELMARIGGIQKSMYTGGNLRWLRGLEKKLQSELAEILKKEEMMWFQRSRAKWLMDGDRNTRYYHLKTINRRRYNNVIMLRNDFGEWVEDPVQLQSMVNNFYYDLFSKSNERWEWMQADVTFPILNRETFDMLGMPIEDQEVKKALFSMSPWKAPSPDGYPAGF
jgi:hypothetical protein